MWEYVCQEKKEYKGFERRLKKKGKKEYRVSGSWNRQPESTWSKSNGAVHAQNDEAGLAHLEKWRVRKICTYFQK